MSLYNAPNMSGGVDQALIGIAGEVVAFPIMILIFVFSFVFLVGMGSQIRRSGYADAPLWATLGSLAMFMVALVFTLSAGIINLMVLSIVVTVTIFSAIWLFLSRGRYD